MLSLYQLIILALHSTCGAFDASHQSIMLRTHTLDMYLPSIHSNQLAECCFQYQLIMVLQTTLSSASLTVERLHSIFNIKACTAIPDLLYPWLS
jgi:hypothetical protein